MGPRRCPRCAVVCPDAVPADGDALPAHQLCRCVTPHPCEETRHIVASGRQRPGRRDRHRRPGCVPAAQRRAPWSTRRTAVTYTRKAVDVRNHADAVRDPGYDSPRRTRYYSRPHHETAASHLQAFPRPATRRDATDARGCRARRSAHGMSSAGAAVGSHPWARWLAEDLERPGAHRDGNKSMPPCRRPGRDPARKEPQSRRRPAGETQSRSARC